MKHHFGAKITQATLLSKWLHPFLFLDPVISIQIKAFFVLFKHVD